MAARAATRRAQRRARRPGRHPGRRPPARSGQAETERFAWRGSVGEGGPRVESVRAPTSSPRATPFSLLRPPPRAAALDTGRGPVPPPTGLAREAAARARPSPIAPPPSPPLSPWPTSSRTPACRVPSCWPGSTTRWGWPSPKSSRQDKGWWRGGRGGQCSSRARRAASGWTAAGGSRGGAGGVDRFLPTPPPSRQTASGAVACQLMDALHPGSVNLAKVREGGEGWGGRAFSRARRRPPPRFSPSPPSPQVDFNSRSEYDSINNYKALQAALARAGVDKVRRARGGAGRGRVRALRRAPSFPPPPLFSRSTSPS